MNKRNRNLIALLSVMLLLVIALCACMTQNQQNEAETTAPVTTDPGFGVETWGNIPSAGVSGDAEQPTQDESFEEPSQSTQPTETESTQATTAPNPYTPGSLTYEEYLALDGAQQQLYAMSFDSVESYINWYNAALAEHENGDVVEITGPVDLEDYS